MSPHGDLEADRAPEVVHVVLVDHLPAGLRGCYISDGETAVIAVDRNLPEAEREAVIAHELAHHERGGSGHRADAPPSWRVVVAREEERVDRLVAERLAPDPVVQRVVRRLGDLGEAVTAEGVADELGVARSVAHRSLLRLQERGLA
jgi:Zn-dependent peptidase ImmA (M78 family)